MELSDTVDLFCTEDFVDAFNSGVKFKGKVNPFAEVANSGAASQRRILETPITETIPSGRVIISPANEKFIVADVNVDFWNGSAIRYKYPILPVDTMGAVGTIGDILASAMTDSAVYAYPYFVRRESDEDEQSDFFSGYEISFPKTKIFSRASILHLGSRYYRFKTDTWTDGAGFSVAQVVLLENPLRTLSVIVNGTTYDPSTDRFVAGSPVSVVCFVEFLKQDYEFVSPAFEYIKPGDRAVSLLKSAATIKVNDKIGNYQVISVRDEGTWNTCHCRNIKG